MSSRVPAVIVGLCSHGLAICRSLNRRNVPVFALESNSRTPGWQTRCAVQVLGRDINGTELIEDLIRLRPRFQTAPVLFLTNDRMVRTIATHFSEIAPLYRLNWPAPQLVLRLLDKASLAGAVKEAGLEYPHSFTVKRAEQIEMIRSGLHYPLVLKPTAPLSPFKALKIDDEIELCRKIRFYEGQVEEFLIQEWISGSERSIHFINFYYDQRHRPIAAFVGRKIRAYPRATGSACSAEPCHRPDLVELADQFFRGLSMSGPAALEIKEDNEGRQFVIEPTVGRTEYLVLCCIRNGVDIPYLAYASQTNQPLESPTRPSNPVIWVDWERDLPMYLQSWSVREERGLAFSFLLRRKVFAVWSKNDPLPSLVAWLRGCKTYAKKLIGKLMKINRQQPS